MFIRTKMRPETGELLLTTSWEKIITSPNSNPISTGIGNTDLPRESANFFFLCKHTFTFLKLKITSLVANLEAYLATSVLFRLAVIYEGKNPNNYLL